MHRDGHQRRWSRRLLAVPALAGLYLLGAGHAAQASLFVAPGPNLPDRVTVGRPFSAQLGVGNFTTAPESALAPVVAVAEVDLVPACGGELPDCLGAVEAGVFRLSATGTASSGPPSCRGTWTISEIRPGVFRFTPPGGEGSVQLAIGEVCVVDYTATALRVPTGDTTPSTGVQTNQVVSATAQLLGVVPVRVANPGQTTVDPAPRRPMPVADYDGDGKGDLVVFRPAQGGWFIRASSGGEISAAWGLAGDVPVLGDYDGDGRTDLAVYRPSAEAGMWFIRHSGGGERVQAFGAPGDVPVPADYDGDGRTDVAVFRAGGEVATWLVSGSAGSELGQSWGVQGDVPVPGDYDGDGRADIAVFRPSYGLWFVRHASGGTLTEAWGAMNDIPVPADYDGDGRTDVSVYRPALGVWFLHRSSGSITMQAWGVAADVPVPADTDGDGAADPVVFRPSESLWYARLSSGETATSWGVRSDILVGVPPALRG